MFLENSAAPGFRASTWYTPLPRTHPFRFSPPETQRRSYHAVRREPFPLSPNFPLEGGQGDVFRRCSTRPNSPPEKGAGWIEKVYLLLCQVMSRSQVRAALWQPRIPSSRHVYKTVATHQTPGSALTPTSAVSSSTTPEIPEHPPKKAFLGPCCV